MLHQRAERREVRPGVATEPLASLLPVGGKRHFLATGLLSRHAVRPGCIDVRARNGRRVTGRGQGRQQAQHGLLTNVAVEAGACLSITPKAASAPARRAGRHGTGPRNYGTGTGTSTSAPSCPQGAGAPTPRRCVPRRATAQPASRQVQGARAPSPDIILEPNFGAPQTTAPSRDGSYWPVPLTCCGLTSIFCSNLRTMFDISNHSCKGGQSVFCARHGLTPGTALLARSAAFVTRPATARAPVAAPGRKPRLPGR
jgi:hypothetical protein